MNALRCPQTNCVSRRTPSSEPSSTRSRDIWAAPAAPATMCAWRTEPSVATPRRSSAPLLASERQQQVRRWLVDRGSVRVAESARVFRVSAETIRRDLRALADEGLADPVHGGAVLRDGVGAPAFGVPHVTTRALIEQRAKNAIGVGAAARVRSGQVVVLDAGTTTLAVAHHLRQHRELTVVTNSVAIAQVAAAIPASTVYVIGGKLVPESQSTIGPQAQRDLAGLRADWAFLGAAAVDVDGGFMSADPYEAEVKRAMIKTARQVALVLDATKFGARRFVSFGTAADIHLAFTSPGVPRRARRWLQSAGVEVVVCDSEAI